LSQKVKKNFWGGGTAPSPDPTPVKEGDPTALGTFGALILVPAALDLGAADLGAFGASWSPPNEMSGSAPEAWCF